MSAMSEEAAWGFFDFYGVLLDVNDCECSQRERGVWTTPKMGKCKIEFMEPSVTFVNSGAYEANRLAFFAGTTMLMWFDTPALIPPEFSVTYANIEVSLS